MDGFEQPRSRRGVGFRRFAAGLAGLAFLVGLLFFSQATIVATTLVERTSSGEWRALDDRGLAAGIGAEEATSGKCRPRSRGVRVTGLYLGRPRAGEVLSRPGAPDCDMDEWRVGITLGRWGQAP